MRQHQRDVAALEQWTPLIAKLSFKAAQRAAKIGSSMRQEDFRQELSITLLRALDSYDPNNEAGAKFITFLYRAFYNEINKILMRDTMNLNGGVRPVYDPNAVDEHTLREMLEEGEISVEDFKRKRRALHKTTIRTVSGDHIAESDDGGSVDVWGYIEDDSERSAENLVMDADLMRFVQATLPPGTAAVLDILTSGAPFLAQQLELYNAGVQQEYEDTGKRRLHLDLNFAFVCKLLGFSQNKANKLEEEIKTAVKQYAG